MKQRILRALVALCIGMALTLSVHGAEPYGFYMNDYVKPWANLNVRSGAGTGYTTLGTVYPGNFGEIIGGPTYNNGYYWWRVKYAIQGITGWCAQDWLTLWYAREEKNFSSGYVLVTYIDGTPLRARSGAGIDYSVVGSYSEGTVGRVIGGPTHNHAYVWWRVEWPNGVQGWSVQRYLTVYTPPADTVKPVITLLGSASVTIDYGASYTDAGGTASDNVDGNITGRIVVTGLPISTTSPGTYYIRYNVTDNAGNKANEVVRTVTVRAQSQITNASRIIFGNTLGTGWQNGSWGVSYNTGGGYIAASYTTLGGELYFHTPGFTTTGYHMLSFFVRPTTVDEPLYVHVHYADGSFSWAYHVRVLDHVAQGVFLPNQFQVVRIPLSALGAHNTLITGITFKNDHATRVGFDEIRFSTFTNQSGACHEY